MQMAAPLAIGLLGWYAWYETDSKFWLYDIYFFTGLATLAKGPVAPFLAIVIVAAFAFLRREWSILRRSLWWPGVVLYFAMVLPWFIAVQYQNPTFSASSFSNTTWSDLLPIAISTSSLSGITWWLWCWP
jgi:4-amino-4-deoxy-L-arabinose transferase-like glycosyltransferase